MVIDFLLSPAAQAHKQDHEAGATAPCSTSTPWRPTIAPASTPCRSESRRCRRTSSRPYARSRIHPGWKRSRRSGFALQQLD